MRASANNLPAAGREPALEERDAELVDPTGRWQGVDGLVERIERYRSASPGTTVVPASGVDAHNDVVRCAWAIIDPEGRSLIDGLDVAERTSKGRLRRSLMFHGPLPVREEASAQEGQTATVKPPSPVRKAV